jgi:hypothetical protein
MWKTGADLRYALHPEAIPEEEGGRPVGARDLDHVPPG